MLPIPQGVSIMFVTGFFTALGVMAAVVLVSAVVIVPVYLYICKYISREIKGLKGTVEDMKKGQENLANFEGTKQ
jgi:hypothetical protein